ncbi:kinesin-like nuclear fusion protein [Malassezia vespertilionis]|uniref:kinesin-like nuclear fusion protein n=1 Tax=Malassezia vespertilionis TaxID=2020962 RepID=UPI0024B176EF|nr:kinesin-like nuclear fusion protein [Malassezia vespertilionis]WFD08534.1 kinesin-like nuclear fusion protein [Malassezia vespertilionis]
MERASTAHGQLSPSKTRAQAKRKYIASHVPRGALENETNRVGARRVLPSEPDPHNRSLLHGLFHVEAQRREATKMRDQEEQEEQTVRLKQQDQVLSAQRKSANANRAPASSWRGVSDYEYELLRAEQDKVRKALELEVEAQRAEIRTLQEEKSAQSAAHAALLDEVASLRANAALLMRQLATHDDRSRAMQTEAEEIKARNAHLEQELCAAETLRRKLHNQVQELRGNVRVYARVRPPRAGHDGDLAEAEIRFPDGMLATQLEVVANAESATGAATKRTHAFAFDRVFPPSATQKDVFVEVSALMQSVLDGYNTTIFAYGQTGSGKTHTLEGGAEMPSSAIVHDTAGLIPRAMHMVWQVAEKLRAQGWEYEFEAQMLQIYLDHIYDLLGTAASDKEKHEVRHTATHTSVSNTVTVPMHGPQDVFSLLECAKKRRQVAATLMNERSSRSHSVFMLRVRGKNSSTNETSDATLNLVDLAGSERLAASGSANDPTRLKEAQSINKSLSSLADVIAALGNGPNGGAARHVPYRNSTLTWLLKNSLGGNAKTCVGDILTAD